VSYYDLADAEASGLLEKHDSGVYMSTILKTISSRIIILSFDLPYYNLSLFLETQIIGVLSIQPESALHAIIISITHQ